ncbi:excisionase family DNA-binding protein [Clostridium estertheticum]|uniref:excisionase family DNA-binding protein n=1 Tax=Clostridium estertheticum TaxID=238834 RepID=UPI001C0AD0A0|nr:excisionase family DNA-binding protein [Clostridium estertheticum]MBU3075621.1 excisionase family DNA-binding protein [Clostridium estertheticum]MBU3164797.1 excisionase family DNA-binding protein [Clostridium estertheticum]
MSKRLLLNQAAEALGVTAHYLRMEVKAGRMPYLRVGNRYVIDVEQVEEFLKNKAMENMKPSSDVNIEYGVLRKCAG